MNPCSGPDDAKRLCTFAFCFTNAPNICNRFQENMKRIAQGNLEMWNVPLYHIGDAELHYPRVGIDASLGPPLWSRVYRPTTIPLGIIDGLEFPSYDGEWFDLNDVAEYVRSKDLTLDTSSVIAEMNDDQKAIPQPFFVDSGSIGYGDPLSRKPVTKF